MKTRAPLIFSRSIPVIFSVSVIMGILYSQGSQISEFGGVLYILLWLIVYTRFFELRLSKNNISVICLLVILWSKLWLISIFLNSYPNIIIWKASIGAMWFLVGLIIISDHKSKRKKEFYWFLSGFGITILTITIANLNLSLGRLSFIGDPRAPHVFASALIFIGSASLAISSQSNSKARWVMLVMGVSFICLSTLTLSKTSFLALLLLAVYCARKYPILVTTFIVLCLMFFLTRNVQLPDIDLSRIYTFRLADASISGRFGLFYQSVYASISSWGMPGYILFPKTWIDTSIGSMISAFGLLGTIPIIFFIFRQVKLTSISLCAAFLILIFLTTEHLILPRILLPFTLLIFSLRLSSILKINSKSINFA